MIIIVSNRNVETVDPDSNEIEVGDENIFGDDFNTQGGPNELRVASAVCENDNWKVSLLPDTKDDNSPPASETLFQKTLSEMRDKKISKSWVVFIHGFNQSFEKNLKKCKEIEDYGVNVLAFSWPSNPGPNGGFFKAIKNKREEYRKARANARLSVTATDRFMGKIVNYIQESTNEDCRISVNLLIHSLGNYLFQRSFEEQVFSNDLRVFDNIIMHQADVDHENHHKWVDCLSDAKRVYITINLHDQVLKVSTMVNGRRLGNTPYRLEGKLPVYFDFTYGEDVGSKHRLWRPSLNNTVIKEFFKRVLKGKQAETINGLVFNESIQAYQLEKRPDESFTSD
ncbi:MAG: alpha/beta hydrolase [Nitrospinae bacterium]|nr:alpha/beta hydrolase [Nitrospinota bacterium]